MENGTPQRKLGTRLALCAIVLCSGAAVMVYEFIAVRILQRDFGSTFEIWAAEITVCMAGLAIGYRLGGRIADRYHSWTPLGVVLILAGLTALPMERLALATGEYLFSLEDVEPTWWWPIAAATASTFVPILVLGAVLPQAIRLHVREVEHVGSSAGVVASVSTLGSIAGVLLITFLLLPYYGLRATLLSVSAVVIALGGVVVAFPLVRSKLARSAVVVLALGLSLISATARAEILIDKYTPYHHILVEDTGNQRMLRFDNTRQSRMNLDDPTAGGFEYTDFFHIAAVLNPSMSKVLFVGLGGGTGPKSFLRYYPKLQIDAVEIDPEVISIAREFFAVPEDPRLKISASDGRVFLRRSKTQYDAIFMDAYSTGPYGLSLPYHLTTVEFFRIARKRLEDGGCLVYNVVEHRRKDGGDRVMDIVTTLDKVFEGVYAFRAKSSLNTVLVAVKIEKPDSYAKWPKGPIAAHPQPREKLQELTNWMVKEGRIPLPRLKERVTQVSRAQTAPRDGLILTDDFAPTDLAPRKRRR